MMLALFILCLLCVALPNRFGVVLLPAVFLMQNLAMEADATLFTAGPVGVMPSDLVLLALLVKAAVHAALHKELTLHKPVMLVIGVFLLVNLLASFVAGIKFGNEHMMSCLVSWSRLFSEVLLVLIAAQAVANLRQAKICAVILLAFLGVLVAIQFVNFFGAERGIIIGEVQGLERGEPRYFGPLGDSVGVVLLLGYSLSLCFASAIGAGAFLSAILLTAGLGAVFATAVATIAFAVFGTQTAAFREKMRRHFWIVPAAAVVAIGLAAVLVRPFSETLLNRLDTGNFENSKRQRLATAEVARAMISANPFTGVGYMGFENALPRYGGKKLFISTENQGATANANNQFLQELTNSGVFGLVAFLSLVFVAGRLLFSLSKGCGDRFLEAFFAGVFVWLLAQVFGNLAAAWLIPSAHVARLLWILLGMAVAVERALAREKEDIPIFLRTLEYPAQATS